MLAALIVGVVVLAMALPASAQAPPTRAQQQEQHRRAQQQARRRARQRRQPHVQLQKGLSTDYRRRTLPTESPCFTFRSIRLQGEHLQAFTWVSDYLREYVGRCVGQRGLNLIVRRATDLILAHGYVTTRLLVPKQNLSSGTLHLLLVPGTVGVIRYAPGSAHVTWRNALPLRPGDVLNLRAIEQGLEQMQRVPSQHVHINIKPGVEPGVSDLVLDVQRTRRWRGSVSYNDAGLEATGKQQARIHFALEQPLGINDLLSVGLGGYVGDDNGKGTRSNSLRYSVPRGYWTFAVATSGYTYHRQVEGTVKTFRAGGRARSTAVSAKRVIHRSTDAVTSLQLTLSAHNAHSYIAGVQIQVQRRHTRAIELALVRRRYIGRAQLDWRLAQRRGVPWFGGQSNAPGTPDDAPTFHYILDTFNAQLSLPFRWGAQTLLWRSTLHAQFSRDRLYAANFITLGGRYTVRGFDGERTLAAEHGWFWRNSLGVSLGHGVTRVYGGIDMGHVGGAGMGGAGRGLAGAFVGLRGAAYGFHWNFFAGWALHAPSRFSTRRPAAGMQVVYQF